MTKSLDDLGDVTFVAPVRRFKSTRAIFALILREMETTYGRNAGGYLWAILEPIAAIALLATVFSLAFSNPPIGTDFVLFYASGYLPFMLYSDVTQKVSTALRFSMPLLAYPAVRYIDAIIGRFILNFLTHILVFALVLPGIVMLRGLTIIVDIYAILMAIVMAAAFILGMGILNAFLFSKVRVWERIWGILNRPLFIISGVLFTYDSVPSPFSDYMWLNPVVHIIGMMRAGLFATYDAAYVSVFYTFTVSAILGVLGLVLLNRYHRDIINDV